MSFLTENLNQTVVYWGSPTPDGYGGFTFASPIELFARWEDKTELFINNTGQESKSLAVVFVSQDVEIAGWLFLGEISDIDSGLSDMPYKIDGARQIRGFKKIPNLDITEFERKVWL